MATRHAYRRFVRAGMDGSSPWPELRSQIYLRGKLLARMNKLAAEQDKKAFPKTIASRRVQSSGGVARRSAGIWRQGGSRAESQPSVGVGLGYIFYAGRRT